MLHRATKTDRAERSTNASFVWCSFFVFFYLITGHLGRYVWPIRDRHFHFPRATGTAHLRAAHLPQRRLPLDPWLLGLRRRRLFLDFWRLDSASRSRLPLDSRLLGLEWRGVCLQSRLLGPNRGLLWGYQLRLRLHR